MDLSRSAGGARGREGPLLIDSTHHTRNETERGGKETVRRWWALYPERGLSALEIRLENYRYCVAPARSCLQIATAREWEAQFEL